MSNDIKQVKERLIESLGKDSYLTCMVAKEDLVRLLVAEFTLDDYESPLNEASTFKNIPIQYLAIAKILIKKYVEKYETHFGANCNVRIRYRGPRKGNYYTTLKENATHFSVYIDW